MKQKIGLFILQYLRFFAHLQLRKLKLLNPNLKIVGITGSAGKTSCLLACEAALKPHFKVKNNYGGNSESGIPLSILDIKIHDFKFTNWFFVCFLAPIKFLTNWQKYDILLLEMGIDSAKPPKNMDYLLSIVTPDIGIFLNVSSTHLQEFRDIDQIASEKAKLINSVNTAIINASDPLVKKYSHNQNLLEISPQNIKIPHFIFPKAFDITFGSALKLGSLFNIPQAALISNIKSNFHPAPGRNSLFVGIKESTIIDSSYNSSPLATAEMLDVLKTYPSPRIAVLGDMRELGTATKLEHKKIYDLAEKSADQIITVGENFISPNNFKYWWEATDFLKNNLSPHATILVKGSQNTIFLEELVKELVPHETNLCRQSPYWLQLKTRFRKNVSTL